MVEKILTVFAGFGIAAMLSIVLISEDPIRAELGCVAAHKHRVLMCEDFYEKLHSCMSKLSMEATEDEEENHYNWCISEFDELPVCGDDSSKILDSCITQVHEGINFR